MSTESYTFEENANSDLEIVEEDVSSVVTSTLVPEPPLDRTLFAGSRIFNGIEIDEQPESFFANIRDIKYFASDKEGDGDKVKINGDTFRFSARGFKSFVSYADIKEANWFLTNFNEIQRNDMARTLLANASSREFRFFIGFDDNKEAVIFNMLPKYRPVISDYDFLTTLEETMSGGIELSNFFQGEKGIVAQVLCDVRREVESGDNIQFGIQATMSQLGWVPPTLGVYVFRYNSASGMSRKDNEKAWIFGGKDESYTDIDMNDWIAGKVPFLIRSFGDMLQKMKDSTSIKVSPVFLADIIAENHLATRITRVIDTSFSKEMGDTRWIYANAICRAATEGLFNPETQLKLERIGGNLVLS